jgi:hypothetical protein
MDPIHELLESMPEDRTVLVSGDQKYAGPRVAELVYKTGNFLRHCGVHPGSTVEVAPEVTPETVIGLLGTGLLGGRVAFGVGSVDGPKVRFGPMQALEDSPVPAGCTPVAFGAEPESPSWAYFGRDVWSENPFFPETDLDPSRDWLPSEAGPGSVDSLFGAADRVAEGLQPGDTVAVRVRLDTAAAVVGGILAPLVAGARILLPGDEHVGTHALATGDVPEEQRIDLADIR